MTNPESADEHFKRMNGIIDRLVHRRDLDGLKLLQWKTTSSRVILRISHAMDIIKDSDAQKNTGERR